ncbi:hypothetical protein [Streptomyces sp. NPDC002994]|uniref:hypothetical protein n=1 Tax=Streptomyces sp. NPDC002994 TaxID=3154441 RepID=UPI0033A2E90F
MPVDHGPSAANLARWAGAARLRRRGNGVGAAVACDVLDTHGLIVPAFGEQLTAELRAHLPPTVATGNPVDVTGGGEQDVNCYAEVADRVLASGEVDALVLTGYFGGYHAYGPGIAAREREVAARMAASAAAHGRMLAVHSMFADSDAAAELRAGGVPVFGSIESLARGISAATRGAAGTGVPEVPLSPAEPITDADYWPARTLLAAAGVLFPRAALVRTRTYSRPPACSTSPTPAVSSSARPTRQP